MGRRLIAMTEINAILYRWTRGNSRRDICRSLNIGRNTVRSLVELAQKHGLSVGDSDEKKILEVSHKIIKARVLEHARNRPVTEKLKAYHEEIREWLDMPYITVKQIWRLLREKTPSVQIGVTSLHRYVERHFQPKTVNATMVLPTVPGEQAQVDFGYVGLMQDPVTGKNKKAQAFVMTLSHSRHRFVYFVFQQDTVTWVDCHRRAFEFFGGVTKTVLLDNLKAGVLKADLYDPTINRAYAECERHYGFAADPAKVRTPEHKGKVERSITIVKQQVIGGRKFKDINDANNYAWQWAQEEIANVVTRTTGETPRERFERDDKPALLALPEKPFECPVWSECQVGRDQHVTYLGSFYSIPERYVGQAVSVRATMTLVRFYHKNVHIKTHVSAARKGEWVTDILDLKESSQHYLKNTPELCLGKAKMIGPSTYRVVEEVLHKRTTSRLRKAQAILRLAEMYDSSRLEAACDRGLEFDTIEYQTLKNILEKELDKLMPENEIKRSVAELSNGAFLRDPSEFMIH